MKSKTRLGSSKNSICGFFRDHFTSKMRVRPCSRRLLMLILFSLHTFASAQTIVLDPMALIESIEQTSMFIESVHNQITMIENAINEAERQIRMMTQMPEKLLNEAVNFVEDQVYAIQDIKNIARAIDTLRLNVENTVMDASDLYLSMTDYEYWYDTALSESERLAVAARDAVRTDWIRELNRQFAGEAHSISQNLKDRLEGGWERILDQVSHLVDVDSTVAQLQGANLMAMETYSLLGDMAQSIDVLTRSMTGYVYSEGEKMYMAAAGDVADVLGKCPTDYYVDPFTLDYEEILEDSIQEIMEEGSSEFVDEMDLFQQEMNQLRQTGRKYGISVSWK